MSEERILDAVRAEYEGRRQALKGIATGLPAVVGDGFRQTSGGSPSELATVSSTVTVVPRGRPRTGLPLVTDSDVQEHMDRARAPATNRKRFYTLRNYRELCVRQGNEPFPVTAVTLVEYIVSLTKKAIMYDTVCDYLGIVRVESRKFSESKLSQMEDEEVRLALQAAKRILRGRDARKRTVTLTIDKVRILSSLVPSSGRAESTVAYLVGMMALLRLKEVAQLELSDIDVDRSGSFMVVTVQRSKTDQAGTGQKVYVGCTSWTPSRIKECEDPWCALHRLLRHLQRDRRSSCGKRLFAVSYKQLSSDIKDLVTTVLGDDYPAEEIGKRTSQSMRRTGVCLLANAGVRIEAIAEYGRWSDVRTVQNNYMRGHTDRRLNEKEYGRRMMLTVR